MDASALQIGKGTLRGAQKATIPPPPKSKAEKHAIQVTDEHSSQSDLPKPATVPDIVVTQHDTSDGLTQGGPGKSAADITGLGSPPEIGSEPSRSRAKRLPMTSCSPTAPPRRQKIPSMQTCPKPTPRGTFQRRSSSWCLWYQRSSSPHSHRRPKSRPSRPTPKKCFAFVL